ncbi:unnamed protein product [Dicrocoelium dendriticum]|nr:unnamed protein product [Dicrocoelium dendriticum]
MGGRAGEVGACRTEGGGGDRGREGGGRWGNGGRWGEGEGSTRGGRREGGGEGGRAPGGAPISAGGGRTWAAWGRRMATGLRGGGIAWVREARRGREGHRGNYGGCEGVTERVRVARPRGRGGV